MYKKAKQPHFLMLVVLISVHSLLFSNDTARDTVPDLTEQTNAVDVLRLPNGAVVEVEMYEEFTVGNSKEEQETRRKSHLACVSDIFAGKVRKYAKTVPHSGRAKTFSSIADLLEWLPSDSSMKFHEPKIDRSEASQRVAEEQKNVLLKEVWLMAIYREDDNDFHLILCDQKEYDGEAALFSAEIAGLPDASTVSAKTMGEQMKVRNALISRLGNLNCGRTYILKKGGLPIRIKGSLFFDIHHAGQVHGRQGLYPKSAWEIHPVTELKWLEVEE